MWNGPIKHIPGCTCSFIDGYHSHHIYECALEAKARQEQKDRNCMNLELNNEQKAVAKEALQAFWQECQNMVTYWDNLMRLNKKLGMPDNHVTMMQEKQHREEWQQKMTDTHNLLRQLEG